LNTGVITPVIGNWGDVSFPRIGSGGSSITTASDFTGLDFAAALFDKRCRQWMHDRRPDDCQGSSKEIAG
jgi:hypothetical protein